MNEIQEGEIVILQNKTAVITGCNRGIGESILMKFAQNGANVFAHARKRTDEFEEKCKKLGMRYNVKIFPIYFDAIDSTEMKRAVNRIIEISKGNIDILVNNMGTVNSVKLFQMTKISEMKEEFEVNFFSQIEFTQYISRIMIRRKEGSIINISSCAGIDGNTGMLQYVSSKAAMIGATKRLAIELGVYNIRVNSVAPGLTETDMGNQMSDELEKEVINHLIIKRKAKKDEIADAVLFLASDMSSYITGQILRVDGGMLN